MDFYSMEQFEIMGDMLEELALLEEEEAFERDMLLDPWDMHRAPTDGEICAMFLYMG